MCIDGGGGSTTTTQKLDPPEWTKQGWTDISNEAGRLAQQPYQNYNMPRVAPINELQDAGLQMAADRGLNGDPYGNSSRQLGLQTMNGDFLNGNPYLDRVIGNNAQNMADSFSQGTAATNAAMANMQGAFGGSGYSQKQSMDAAGLAKATGQMADQARSNNYQFERGAQQNAMGMSGQFAADDRADIKGLVGAGDAYSSHEQQLLDSGYQQMQDQINYPWQQLSKYANLLSQATGTSGSTNTSQMGGGSSGLAQLLGIGAGAYGLKAGGFF